MLKKVAFAIILLANPATAEEKSLTLSAPQALIETGIIRHIIPRFSLKNGIRVTLAEPGDSDTTFGSEGVPVFRQGDTVWHLAMKDTPYTDTFLEWITSDVGKRTIESFQLAGQHPFSTDVAIVEDAVNPQLTGDAALGEEVSMSKCGRCHVVNEKNRMKAIGSTPSFALMRSFDDWRERFSGFYALRPHGAFTQVPGVTDPFPVNRPSPISPIEVTLDEIEAITAYVASIEPADLGAPLESGSSLK